MMLTEVAAQMEDWSAAAGRTAMASFRHTGDLVFKAGHQAVTAVDRRIETTWRELIAREYPDDLIVGEELGGPGSATIGDQDRVWYLDPIDGTLNYAAGLPGFCTSLALLQGKQVLAACVHQPATGDMFTAVRGGGARLNGEPIRVSGRAPLNAAVISAQLRRDGPLVAQPDFLRTLCHNAMKVRFTGAIALELAWTAAGFYDGLVAGFPEAIHLYDVAAGMLLVQEAGGVVSDFRGQAFQAGGRTLLASNGRIHGELVACAVENIPSRP